MRILLLIFLVAALPLAVYLAANGGFANPEDALANFAAEVRALPGPEREEEPEEELPEPPPAEDDETPESKPDEPAPQKPDEPEAPAKPAVDADALFAKGEFAAAASAMDDTRRRALAQFGAALSDAFPPPPEPYVVVELTSGSEQEGFATDSIGEVRLMAPTGSAMGLPTALVASKRELSSAQVVARNQPKIEEDAQSGDTRRLFRAAAAAFRIGRPDLAAPMLRRIVESDAQTVLKAITKDVPAAARDALFRAYSEAAIANQAPPPKPTNPIGTAKSGDDEPKRDNPLKIGNGKKTHRSSRLEVKDERARKLMSEARPLREEGQKLYDKVFAAGLDKADPSDIDTAIRKYKAALDLYEKAFEIEDNDTLYALLTGCSKNLFRLRFWKEQVGDR